jgi:hypothetical protein
MITSVIGNVRDHALLESDPLNLARHIAKVNQIAIDLAYPHQGFLSTMLSSVLLGQSPPLSVCLFQLERLLFIFGSH